MSFLAGQPQVPTFSSFANVLGSNMLGAELRKLKVVDENTDGSRYCDDDDEDDDYDPDHPFQYFIPSIEQLSGELGIRDVSLTLDFLNSDEITYAFEMIYATPVLRPYQFQIETPGLATIIDLLDTIGQQSDPDQTLRDFIANQPHDINIRTIEFLIVVSYLFMNEEFKATYPGIVDLTECTCRMVTYTITMILEILSRRMRGVKILLCEDDCENDGKFIDFNL